MSTRGLTRGRPFWRRVREVAGEVAVFPLYLFAWALIGLFCLFAIIVFAAEGRRQAKPRGFAASSDSRSNRRLI